MLLKRNKISNENKYKDLKIGFLSSSEDEDSEI
jgi:hypothetical protein